MFGFLIKDKTNNGLLVYDGNKMNLKYCINADEADRWYESIKPSEWFKREKRFSEKIWRMNVPIMSGEIITNKFNDFIINEKSISPQVTSARAKALKEFEIVYDNMSNRIGFMKRVRATDTYEGLPDGGLMRMKDFIMGLYRLEPIMMQTDKKNFIPIDFEQHFDGKHYGKDRNGEKFLLEKIKYNWNGKQGETPVYGVYTPQLRAMMLDGVIDFGGGRTLQKRQLQTSYHMARESYLAAPREGGKSILASIIASLHPCRTLVDPREKIDGPIVYYYGISHPSNKSVVNKILRLNKKFRQGELFRWSGADKTLYFMDGGDIAGYVEFLSDDAPEPGRGGRPKFVIVDEAARISDNVKNIITGFHDAVKFYISTINYDTQLNWFYEGLKRAEIKMLEYKETMDELIVELWLKHEMDKVESPEQLLTPEWKEKLIDLKREFLDRRPIVGFRYTINDVEYLKESERQRIIEEARERGDAFMRAELFSELADDTSIFAVEKNRITEDELPPLDTIESFVFSYDAAEQHDNPALAVLGVRGKTIYQYNSDILSHDDDEKLKAIQDTFSFYKKFGKRISFVADCTQAPKVIRSWFEDRGITIDMPLKNSKGGDYKFDNDGFMVLGKKGLIEICQKFFKAGTIKIPDRLDIEDGLLQELSFFRAVKNEGTGNIQYKAIKGKDDQVHALLYGLFFLYQEGFRDLIAESDKMQQKMVELNTVEFDEWLAQQSLTKDEQSKIDSAATELFSQFGY